MDILYGKRFSKDLDLIRNEPKVRKRLLELIKKIKKINSIKDLEGVKKIEGYSDYFRIRLGDYRLGVKLGQNRIELIRFLHRKEIYRRFP
jgi:mRNA interferase RelE/StbE